MPRVGFGTAGMAGRTIESVCSALQAGFQLIDTAQAPEWYSEWDLGLALERCLLPQAFSNLTIVTKIHPRNYESATLRASLQRSLEDIYRGHASHNVLDIALLHAPFCWVCSSFPCLLLGSCGHTYTPTSSSSFPFFPFICPIEN